MAAGLWLRRLTPSVALRSGTPALRTTDPSRKIGCGGVPGARLAARDIKGKCRNANPFVHRCFRNRSRLEEAVSQMTDVLAAPRPTPPARKRNDDSYDDVIEMFLALSTMPVESPEYRRQRECIVKRCLPLADHVARHFGRRGEGLDDLTQVARLGLMNAINRFDPDKGP